MKLLSHACFLLSFAALMAYQPGCTGGGTALITPEVKFGAAAGTLLSDRKIDGARYKSTTTEYPDGRKVTEREFELEGVDSKSAAIGRAVLEKLGK
jgi:hypothetical protein